MDLTQHVPLGRTGMRVSRMGIASGFGVPTAAIESSQAPTALIFTRQGLPHQARSAQQLENIARGGYVLKQADGGADAVILASGSEVGLAMAAAGELSAEGLRVSVVSMPNPGLFQQQDPAYRDSVLPPALGARVAVEAGVSPCWAGFVGDRGSWSDWGDIHRVAESWACDPQQFIPLNAPCERDGVDLDGAIGEDVGRGGDLRWPPGRTGLSYQAEALQGLILQAELLDRASLDAWGWEDSALRRSAGFMTRADAWNLTPPGRHVPWLLNARYGLDLPTEPAGEGRVFGFTDWLYGP